MYTKYFNLAEMPFRISPDVRYLWYSEQHSEAKSKILHYITTSSGPVYLIAPVGTGKTSLAMRIKQELETDKSKKVIYVFSPKLTTTNSFLRFIMDEFEVKTNREYGKSLRLFENFLVDQAKSGISPILLIDEGQNMSRGMLTLIQHLFNFSTPTKFLMNMAIFAQPELKSKLKRMESLRSRMFPVHLEPLDQEQTKQMIAYRWTVAGGKICPFDSSAIVAIQKHTNGVPRLIVKVADAACLKAAITRLTRINDNIINAVAGEVLGD